MKILILAKELTTVEQCRDRMLEQDFVRLISVIINIAMYWFTVRLS